LSKLSLRDLALAGRTCREMRKEFLTRLAEERARLVAAGEEFLGKEIFSGFLRTFQAVMRCSNDVRNLNIDAAGERHIASTYWDIPGAAGTDFCQLRMIPSPYLLGVKFPPAHSRVGETKYPAINVRRVSRGQEVQLEGPVWPHTAAATMGILLAICAESPQGGPALWQRPLNTIALYLRGSWGAEGKARAEEVVGPLRSLGRTFTYYSRLELCPGQRNDGAHAASRLVVVWSAY
jgi:hypothetical protein